MNFYGIRVRRLEPSPTLESESESSFERGSEDGSESES